MSCDVIIPVYKSPEWTKLCVYALFRNTDDKTLGTVYLINDCDDPITTNCLKNLAQKYPKIKLLQNKNNLGFIKTVNRGFKASKADYVLLLNTDCLITKHTIEKLITHASRDSKIGLICPISSNAANLTLDIFEGFNYSEMNALLERKFAGQIFDACTVVGNCLLISRSCLDKLGGFDEAYGAGYGDETDYQFKAMAAGFSAKVAIDTYVFHKSEASFSQNKVKRSRQKANYDLFMSRWGEEYAAELKKYQKNDPLEYIKSQLSPEDSINHPKVVFYLDSISQNTGGVHVVADIVNYLSINGLSANIAFREWIGKYQEPMLFHPIRENKIKKYRPQKIVSTVWVTAFRADQIARQTGAEVISLIQGYEVCFDNGSNYGAVETSYRLADELIAVSKYLQRDLTETFGYRPVLIKNGINLDLIKADNPRKKAKTITMSLRGLAMKGDWVLVDLLKKIDSQLSGVKVNIIYQDKDLLFPKFKNSSNTYHKILGPISRIKMYEILQSSDIYVDASQSEGFGLTALESMATGCVPVAANSKGSADYLINNENGFLIDKINDPDTYLHAIKSILKDDKLFQRLKQSAAQTALDYDFDDTAKAYKRVLTRPAKKHRPPKLSQDEQGFLKRFLPTTKKFIYQRQKSLFKRILLSRTLALTSTLVWVGLLYFTSSFRLEYILVAMLSGIAIYAQTRRVGHNRLASVLAIGLSLMATLYNYNGLQTLAHSLGPLELPLVALFLGASFLCGAVLFRELLLFAEDKIMAVQIDRWQKVIKAGLLMWWLLSLVALAVWAICFPPANLFINNFMGVFTAAGPATWLLVVAGYLEIRANCPRRAVVELFLIPVSCLFASGMPIYVIMPAVAWLVLLKKK